MIALNFTGIRGDDFSQEILLDDIINLSGYSVRFYAKYGSYIAINKYIESGNILDSGNINLSITGNDWNDVLNGEYNYCIEVSGDEIKTPILGKLYLIDDLLY
jgi:hypothetical protein